MRGWGHSSIERASNLKIKWGGHCMVWFHPALITLWKHGLDMTILFAQNLFFLLLIIVILSLFTGPYQNANCNVLQQIDNPENVNTVGGRQPLELESRKRRMSRDCLYHGYIFMYTKSSFFLSLVFFLFFFFRWFKVKLKQFLN